MIKNYLKIAFRNLFKERLFSVINLTGLSVGTAVVILIALFVGNEWSFDKFHTKSDRIYRTWVKEHFKGEVIFNTVTPLLLGSELVNNIPEVQESSRYLNNNTLIRQGSFMEQEVIHYVDPSFLKIFDFPLVKGKKEEVLSNPSQVVITEQIGLKYFGDESPIGQTLSIQVGGDWNEFTVSGIIEEAPRNSSIQYDILVPFERTNAFFGEQAQRCWTCVFGETYVLLDEESRVDQVSEKIGPFIDDRVKDIYASGEYIVGMQPLTDIHLNNAMPVGIVPVNNATYPYIFASIALLILLLACINFTTLSVGRSVTRAKEVGVRKVTGASKWQLRTQFWSEALMTSFIALGLGLVLAMTALPFFNSLSDLNLQLSLDFRSLSLLIGLAVTVGLLSGIYPALVLSGFAPIQAIHGIISKVGKDKHLVLRGLVSFQFVLSVVLIICALGIKRQMNFMQDKNLGFSKDQTLIVPYTSVSQDFFESWEEALRLKERFRTELDGRDINHILTSSHTFGTLGWVQLGYADRETDQFRQFNLQQIDYQYLEAMDMELVEGRNFSKEVGTDDMGVIVNETFVDMWQLEDPIGATLPEPFMEHKIIGVAKDFNYSSLHTPIGPLVMSVNFVPLLRTAPDRNFNDRPTPKFSFKIKGDELTATIGVIERAWKKHAPEQAFNYTFMDDNIDRLYRSETKLSQLLAIATFLAIMIACLGLFGIATLTITRRTKEIGVRKVLGASTPQIVFMLNKNFTVLAIIATLVASPIAWYFLRQWLMDFEYSVGLQWWIFALAGLFAIVIAFLTVSFQSVRAASTNPIESLRLE